MPRTQVRIHTHPLTLQDCIMCTRCGEEKELDQFYILRGRHKSGIGYSSYCKQCVKEYRQARIDKRVVMNSRSGRHEIHCTYCETSKPVEEFYSENYAYSRYCKRCTCLSRIAAE